jgi:hypothetical protein
MFNSTNATLRVIPAIPDIDTTIAFNGEQLAYYSDIPDLANWAQYPANNDVNVPAPYAVNASLANISTVNVSTLNVIETNINIINTDIIKADEAFLSSVRGSTLTITADRGTSLFPSFVNINTSNGLYGTIDLTANPGLGGAGGGNVSLTANGGTAPGGLYGQVNIVANQGTATVGGTNVTTGGYINIQANSGGILPNPTLTSRIDLNAGGLNLYSGLLSPIASEFGYTFINASVGASIVAGAFSPSFQVPGSVYLYGTTGIVLGADAYAGNIYPKFDGINPPDNLTINGRSELVGNAFVDVNDINSLNFSGDVNASKAITGLSTINGLPLSDFQYNPDPSFSSITIVSDGLIEVTQIRNTYPGDDITIAQENGTGKIAMSVIPPPAVIPVGDITIRETGQIELNGMLGEGITINPTGDIMTFQTAGLVATGQIDGLSTINGNDVNNPVVSTITTNTSGSVKTTFIQNTVPGPDLRIHQRNGDGSLNLGLYQIGAGIPTGEIDIADSGVIGLNNMISGAGITINQAGDTITFETGGFNPVGKITGLSTINGNDFNNPTVTNITVTNTVKTNEIRTYSPDLGSLMRINLNGTPDVITLEYPSAPTGCVSIIENGVGPGRLDVGSLTSVSSINGQPYAPSVNAIPYTLSGTTAGAVIVDRPIGSGNPFTQNVFTNASQVTFNIPPAWTATDSVSYDGYAFFDFNANFNSFWGITYYTNTNLTPVDLIGSSTTTTNALNYTNVQQVFIPLNLIIPPTSLTVGGTITLTFFCNPTSINHYITTTPTHIAKIGIVRD